MNNKKLKQMVSLALLMALVVVLQMVSGIIPPIGGFTISLVLIPIILGAAVYGPGAGALLGATFGTVVYINCMTGADPGGAMVFQANPILCLLVVMGKGVLAGLASGFVFKLIAPKNTYLAILCAAVICPVVNTGVFVACMLTFFVDVLSAWAGDKGLTAYILTGLVLANFTPELIINVLFSPASHRILLVTKKES